VNADAELDEAGLHFDRAAHRVAPAAELDEAAVAGALGDAPMMRGDGGIDRSLRSARSRDRVRFSSAGPEIRAGFRVNKLGVDAHAVLVALTEPLCVSAPERPPARIERKPLNSRIKTLY
jgi:hypothetical protein